MDYLNEEEDYTDGRINPIDINRAVDHRPPQETQRDPKDLLQEFLMQKMAERQRMPSAEEMKNDRARRMATMVGSGQQDLLKAGADFAASFGNQGWKGGNAPVPQSGFNPENAKRNIQSYSQGLASERAGRAKQGELDQKVLQYLAQMKQKKDEGEANRQLKMAPPAITPYQQKTLELKEKQLDRASELNKMKQEKTASQPALSVGEKSLDTKFASEYIDWTTQGRPSFTKNIQKLEAAKQELLNNPDLTGNIKGRLPDVFQSELARRIKQDVQGAAQGALRATLGAQFTEKEGKKIEDRSYDPALSPAENIKKIDAAIEELTMGANAKNAMSQHYEKFGSLKGWGSGDTGQPAQQISQLQQVAAPNEVERRDPKTGKTVVFDGTTKQFIRYKD